MIDLMLGDCLERIKEIPENSIDSIVTDPPYGLAFMGKKWDYDVPSTEFWIEAFRVLKPGGHLLSFGGTRTYHRLVVNIENAGFEVRDMIQWIYGSGFPKSMDISKAIDKAVGVEREVVGSKITGNAKQRTSSTGEFADGKHGGQQVVEVTAPATPEAKQWEGWGTALKPANEPICVARKPLSESTVAKNVLRWGTGGLNIDGCRIGMRPAQTYTAPDIRGDAFNSDVSNRERKTISVPAQGRWPANVIFDEEAAAALDEQSGNLKSGKPGIKNKGNDGPAYGAESRPPGTQMSGFGDSGGASRFFYCAKASKSERNAGLEGMQSKQVSHMITGSGKPSESVKERSAEGEPNRFTATHQNFHPTVKPIKLMEYLIKLITSEKGCVFDPFMGSGSTGVAAKNLNRKFIGIEKDQEYFEIAKKRILGGNDNDQDQAN